MAHHSDVGGLAPGSIAVHATEIYQEGIRIPLRQRNGFRVRFERLYL